MAECAVFRLWADVPPEQQRQDRPCPVWGVPVTHRGCAAAVQWQDGRGWHRCASPVVRQYGLCRKHAERAGLIEPKREPWHVSGLDARTWNTIKRSVWQYDKGRRFTVSEFRALTDNDILSWRNAGHSTLLEIRKVRDTWTDDALVERFNLLRAVIEPGACNWVGEAVYA